ncbi:guanylate kinase [Paenibacillus sp. CAU 1782]
MIALYGPSASGKTEIQAFLSRIGVPKLITATTRKPREGEKDGVHYHFMSHPAFEKGLTEGAFLEWTRYNGELYGTLAASIEETATVRQHAAIILDLAGVMALKERYSHVFALYIGADITSIKRRLLDRGGDSDDRDRRIRRAEEIELGQEYLNAADEIVWNNDGTAFEDTLRKVEGVVKKALAKG